MEYVSFTPENEPIGCIPSESESEPFETFVLKRLATPVIECGFAYARVWRAKADAALALACCE